MKLRLLFSLLVFPFAASALLVACSPDPAGSDAEDDGAAQAEQALSGTATSVPAGIVKIWVPVNNTFVARTGTLLYPSGKVLTGYASIPQGTNLSQLVVWNGSTFLGPANARVDQPQLGATLLSFVTTPDTTSGWTLSGASPSAIQGHTANCYGFDAVFGAGRRADGLFGAPQSPGYLVSLAAGSAIDDTDDGVPCLDLSDPSLIRGMALSTGPAGHLQVSGESLLPWVNDPTNKTVTITRSSYLGGAGTLSSNPVGVAACNNVAYGTACNTSFMNTTRLAITATPAAGSVATWTGCNSVSGNTCTVLVNGARSVSVRFTACASCYDTCFDGCIGPGVQTSQCVSYCNSRCSVCN